MAKPRRSAARTRPAGRPKSLPAEVRPTPPEPIPPGRRALLDERPHAHIVCRSCGRIAGLALSTDEELRLEEISRSSPDGWSVDLIAFSLTGLCERCRTGPAAPG